MCIVADKQKRTADSGFKELEMDEKDAMVDNDESVVLDNTKPLPAPPPNSLVYTHPKEEQPKYGTDQNKRRDYQKKKKADAACSIVTIETEK